MKRNLSNRTNGSASSREYTFATTCKVAASVVMAMFFTAILTSCSGEMANPHPAQASSLMGSMNKAQGHGYATIDVEAHATDASGNPISAEAHVRYETVKEVEVENEEELGLPVILTANPDGSFTTNNGNVITREESHSANGVTMNVAGGFPQEGSLGERTDEGDQIRQIVFAKISDEAFATASLPEKFDKDWRDSTISVVEFHRIWKKKAAPVEPQYRLRWEIVEIDGNDVYCGVVAEKSVDGGQTWEKKDELDYFMAMSCGNLKPEVNGSKLVTSYDFTTSESKAQLEPMAPRKGEGIAKGIDVLNTIAEDNIWSNSFKAPKDADNNTSLVIGGAQALRVFQPVWHNPETGEEVKLETPFTGEVVTTVNKVDEATGLYTITREVRFNGQFVNSETGTVQLQLAQ